MTPCVIGVGSPDPRTGHLRARVAGKAQYVHRAAWVEANGPVPIGLSVLHRCDNPPCRNVDHLFLGTTGDNNRDRTRKGRSAKGEKNGRAKLTASGVRAIAQRLIAGESMRSIGLEFDIAVSTLKAIRDGKTWTEVTGGPIPGRRYPKRGFGTANTRLYFRDS